MTGPRSVIDRRRSSRLPRLPRLLDPSTRTIGQTLKTPRSMSASPRPNRLPLRRAWELLEQREHERYRIARGVDIPLRPGLSNVQRYSIHNSKLHRADNRYSDVNAYDQTAVKPGGEFLNANIVGDGTGRWWVAAQVRLHEAALANCRLR